MEAIIVIVGFLGSGKTTLIKKLVNQFVHSYWNPFVILNDYQKAQVDAQYFLAQLDSRYVGAISGSCICCSGVNELRQEINRIPKREKGITFVEANGTTDSCTLMGFLGVGIKDQFLPPIQVSVVDTRNWQKRNENNELEANQVQVSSVVVLNYADQVGKERLKEVKSDISKLNPEATVVNWEDFNSEVLPMLHPSNNKAEKMDHQKSHWSSCSVDLPASMSLEKVKQVLADIPKSVLRIKGCTKLDGSSDYSFFERTPTGETFFRPFYGKLVSGPKLLLIGPGSDPEATRRLVSRP